jgi:RNA recognition motif-containing protein
MDSHKFNYLYLYELPKDKVSSVKIAEVFKRKGIDIGTKKPLIKRDLLRPFYSAILNIGDISVFDMAKKKMKYFEMEGCQCRALPYEKDNKHHQKEDVNLFYKHPKGEDKASLTYEYLEELCNRFGPVKSIKIALNPDSTNKGFAYISYEDKDSATKCVDALGADGTISIYKQPEQHYDSSHGVNQVYFNFVPLTMTEAQVRPLFEPFGDIQGFIMKKSDKGQYGYVTFEDKSGKDPSSTYKAVMDSVEKLEGKELAEGAKLQVRKFVPKDKRDKDAFHSKINHKNSMKRCNLYVTNFPSNWAEKEITDVFTQFGEITSVKLDAENTSSPYAFVCFKRPESSAIAK